MANAKKPIIKIVRSSRPYHEEQEWQKNWWGSRLTGFYRSRAGSYKGEIQLSSPARFYLFNPPPELRAHPHWVCFTPVGDRWYRIHFRVQPKDIDSGILAVERMINEAFYLFKRRA